jgi:hypothetical protein
MAIPITARPNRTNNINSLFALIVEKIVVIIVLSIIRKKIKKVIPLQQFSYY